MNSSISDLQNIPTQSGVMKSSKISLILKITLSVIWCAFFIAGVAEYPGSTLVYLTFSVVYLILIVSGFRKNSSLNFENYGYMYLVVMMWLGFWFKFTIRLIVPYPFSEPTGYFVSSPAAWDKVLTVATVGAAGILAARGLYSAAKWLPLFNKPKEEFKTPEWYPPFRPYLWTVLVLVTIILAITNAVFGIQQSGLVPRTILIWPLNAVIYFLLVYGLSFVVSALLWWDLRLQKNMFPVICVALITSLVSTISILSRGVYIFQAIPQLAGIFTNRHRLTNWSHVKSISVIALFGLFLLSSQNLVNGLRAYYYSDVPISFGSLSLGSMMPSFTTGQDDDPFGGSTTANKSKLSHAAPQLGAAIISFGRFAIDRWLGAEGLMAVVAYPGKSWDLFYRQLTEKAKIGKSTIYQEISASHYRFMDMSKYQFATLPGPIAFLYSSSQVWFVLVGMVIITLLVLISECLVSWLTSNPIICSLWGGAAANAAAQMGVAPRGLLIFFFQMACIVIAISTVQSKSFGRLICYLRRLTFSTSEA